MITENSHLLTYFLNILDMVHLCEYGNQSWKAKKVLRAITKGCQSSIRHILLYLKWRGVYARSQKLLHCLAPPVTSSCYCLPPPPAKMLSEVRRQKLRTIESEGALAMAKATSLNQLIVQTVSPKFLHALPGRVILSAARLSVVFFTKKVDTPKECQKYHNFLQEWQ